MPGFQRGDQRAGRFFVPVPERDVASFEKELDADVDRKLLVGVHEAIEQLGATSLVREVALVEAHARTQGALGEFEVGLAQNVIELA